VFRLSWFGKVAILALFAVVVCVQMYPLVWMTISSLRPTQDIMTNVLGLPRGMYLGNFAQVFGAGGFGLVVANSVVVTAAATLGVLICAALAAYAFARFDFRHREYLFAFMLIGLAVGPEAIIIPLFKLEGMLGIEDTRLGLVLAYMAWTPFGVLVLRTAFSTVPRELIDAARMDGCSELGIFWRVTLPLARPALGTVGLFIAVWVWNDFVLPMVLLRSTDKFTIPKALLLYQTSYSTDFGVICAGLTVGALPLILIYCVSQKHFVRGLTAGAIKT
jgi:ABC-type glycerol-3-phosphate transport system permease component